MFLNDGFLPVYALDWDGSLIRWLCLPTFLLGYYHHSVALSARLPSGMVASSVALSARLPSGMVASFSSSVCPPSFWDGSIIRWLCLPAFLLL